jgi:hypothetical protein
MYDMSASRILSGMATSNLRSSRLGAIAWPWRLSVVIGARRRPRGGRIPCSRISLATVRLETRKPLSLSSAWIRGAP